MTVIGITGLARSGKDTVAAVLVEEYGYTRLGFADQLKKLALAIDPIIFSYDDESKPGESFHPADARLSEVVGTFGYEIAKDQYPEVRRFLQALGTKARDFLGSDVWIEAWLQALPGDLDAYNRWVSDADVVTPDVRFVNEAAAINNQDGVIIRVVREGSGLTGSAGQHPSEIEQSEIHADYVLDNNSDIPALRAKVAEIMRDLGNVAA